MLNRIFFITLIVSVITIDVFAQDAAPVPSDTIPKDWIVGGRVGLNFSNVSLSNWAGGGQESVSGTGNFLFTADYKKDKHSSLNSFEVGYGLIKQGDNKVIKSDDKINLSSSYNYNFKPKWAWSSVMTFRTQFAPGYDPADSPADSNKISDWLSPGYIQVATGFEYKPMETLYFLFSPATYKMTLVMDQDLADAGAYGVEADVLGPNPTSPLDTIQIAPGKNVRHEIGASFRMNFKDEIVKNVEFESVLDLFSNYVEDPLVVDVNWINNLNMKINDFMTASILTQLIYDQDIKIKNDQKSDEGSPKVQFKSVVGVGIAYKF